MRGRALAFGLLALASPAHAAPELAGYYQGDAMEIGAALELGADGRFRYGLSYGALDEQSEGAWVAEGDTVYLTTSPAVVPPRFVVESDAPAPAGTLNVRLTDPDALGGFTLTVVLTFAGDARRYHVEADEEGNVPLPPGRVVTSVVPALPVYDIPVVAYPVSPGGHRLAFRFEPNDLGKADFRRQPLKMEGDALILQRHDRTIPFRRR